MDDNIFVYFVDLPDGIHEMVTPCADGYTIYIDARMDRDHQLRAYHHALYHIRHRDFQKDDVQQIEAEAHGIADPEQKEDPRLERIRKNSQIRLKKLQRSKKKAKKGDGRAKGVY